MDTFDDIVKGKYPPPVKTDESYIKKLQHCVRCGHEWSMMIQTNCPKCGGQSYSQHPQLDKTEHIH